jgi:hypothetical protein
MLNEIKVLTSIIGPESTRTVLSAFLQEVGPALSEVKGRLLDPPQTDTRKELRAALHKLRGLLASIRAYENEVSVAQIQEMVKKDDFISAREIFGELETQMVTTTTAVNHYLSEPATP